MPVVDSIAPDYAADVSFVAIAGSSAEDRATSRFAELMPSGAITWGLDGTVRETFGVFGQPVTFAITADGTIIDQWFGMRSEADIRATLDLLVASAT